MPKLQSANFNFLRKHVRPLADLGALAERYFSDDPNTAILKLRQYGELLAQEVAARVGVYSGPDVPQWELLRNLERTPYLANKVAQVFHGLRRIGNRASHDVTGSHGDALHALRLAREAGVWFVKSFHNRDLKPGPFTAPPQDPPEANEKLVAQLREIRETLRQFKSEADEASRRAMEAEEKAAEAEAERSDWEALAVEYEQEVEASRLRQIELLPEVPTETDLKQVADRTQMAAEELDLNEADTRKIIDDQLRRIGWEVDSETITWKSRVRPQKGKNLAISEWPCGTGRADYVLFVGEKAIAVIEAKRRNKNVVSALEQSKRYAREYMGGEEIPGTEYRIPFLFSSNGQPYLEQLKEVSGIWFLDGRKPTNLSRPLVDWYSPQGLEDMLDRDEEESQARLEEEPTDYLPLRGYQVEAIKAVETAIGKGQRRILLAMATGTGKTRTCIGLAYRLLKTRRFRRMLFLVDRNSLGEQAFDAFKDLRIENKTFGDIYEIKSLSESHAERSTRVHFATVQGMVKRIFYARDDAQVPPVDQYDCIVVDECHRGYLLDQEMSDREIEFRDERDYISMYRRVLEYFDSVKVGLTATPALHTSQIFGDPVFSYAYPEAVVDGFLVDQEPPIRITTKLSQEGIHFAVGDPVETYDKSRGQLTLWDTPDEMDFDIAKFNRQVITENFNRTVCAYLARQIDPESPGKTLIFCSTDQHADMVVRVLKEELEKEYDEIHDDDVLKITGYSHKPNQLIRRFKNEARPKFVTTVDLLTTGIDVPAITRLVFLRRVRSRILYDQMVGRATRLCTDIGKESFQIYDAVDLFQALQEFTDMLPVATSPTLTFQKLVEDLSKGDREWQSHVRDQILAKLQRKKKTLERSENIDGFEARAGMAPADFLAWVKTSPVDQLAEWFETHQELPQYLDETTGGGKPGYVISHHEDTLMLAERGYGKYQSPGDYLSAFERYVKANVNELQALTVITQRPRDLTRKQLREIQLKLDLQGFTESGLQKAYRDTKSVEIAASILGFIRRYALGDPLVPYDQRVDRALSRILGRHEWSAKQRRWLERIAKQIKANKVVDREALDSGQFQEAGGFKRLNKTFDGRLEAVLNELNDALWEDAA
jgi:type I restriction enzyme R subunit